MGSYCRYTPDFDVLLPDGTIELHEVKGGFIRDDAAVKLKVAAAMFPQFRWVRYQLKRGTGWIRTEMASR